MEHESENPEETLDLLSPHFDPLLALQASPGRVTLPCPEVKPCDNLEAYRSIVHRTRRPAQAGAAPPADPPGPAGEDELVLPERREKPEKLERSVLWFMQSVHCLDVIASYHKYLVVNGADCTTGPFSLVQRCYANKLRVRVWIRHCAGVRGVCEGVLLAFDKHLNLVLSDVHEHYSPLRTVSNGGKVPKTTMTDTKTHRKRKRKKKKSATGDSEEAVPDDDVCGHCITTDRLISEKQEKVEIQKHSDSIVPSPTPKSVDSVFVKVTPSRTEGCECDPPPPVMVSAEHAGFELSRHVRQLFVRGDNVVLIAHTQSLQ